MLLLRTTLCSLAMVSALSISPVAAQNYEPPTNPALSKSGWPIFHRNSYAQAGTAARGPEPSDRIEVQFAPTPLGEVSSWTVVTAPYSTGAQAAWGTSRTHVWKAILDGPRFEIVSSIAMTERNRFDFDFGIAALADDTVLVTSQSLNEFIIIGDVQRGNPNSPIGVVRRIKIPSSLGKLSTHFSVAFDGTIIFLTRSGTVGALDPMSGSIATLPVTPDSGDVAYHNSFPLDEDGGIYLASQKMMSRVDWNGTGFVLRWQAPIDFRGPGCPQRTTGRLREAIAVARGKRCTGSGTTPTLLGSPNDGVVVVVAGWSPQNRMIAFWRGRPPADWRGLPGYDRQVAGILPLPRSSPDGAGFTMENSPSAWGNGLASAQWNGFSPPCTPVPGVQKTVWDPVRRTLSLAWETGAVNMNGVTTVSAGSALVYGSGRRDCVYRYYGLDWATGATKLDIPMGNDPRYLDQGNQSTLAADRSILFGTAKGLVRIRPSQ